jgi:amino acid adenylation domain-containing protein
MKEYMREPEGDKALHRSRPELATIEPEALTLVQLSQSQIDAIGAMIPSGSRNIQDVYPLSPLQEGMLFQQLLDEHRDSYVLSNLFELQGQAQFGLLIDALQAVIDRHDVLRSAVMWEELPRPIQVVCRRANLPVEELVLRLEVDPINEINARILSEGRSWNLRQAPLLRLYVIANAGNTKRYAVLQVHHLICDHQSLNTIIGEAIACMEGRENQLPRPVPYRNYVTQALESARTQNSEAFFRSKLRDVDTSTAPFGLGDVRVAGDHIEEASQAIDPELAKRIRVLTKRLGVSVARLFHSAWGMVVARTSGRNDVVFGTVLLADRHKAPDSGQMLGMLVNTLPLRLRLGGMTAAALVQQTHQELSDLLNYVHTPLTLAQRCSGVVSGGSLFASILNCRRGMSDASAVRASSTGVRVLDRGEAWSGYPVGAMVDDSGAGFVLTAQTDRRIDPRRVVGYLRKAVQSLVDALERAPETPVLALAILPESERHEVVDSFNAKQLDYPREKLVHELFEEQAARRSDAVAVTYEQQSLTYAELNTKANRLARHLRDVGVGPDSLVALYVDRGFEMLVGLLGILKAGGAYVPLDPAYPADRLTYMLNDAAPKVILTQRKLKGLLPQTSATTVELDVDSTVISADSDSNLPVASVGVNARHMAYVIYTSGSTGRPKGVMVEHAGLCNMAYMQARVLDLGQRSRVLQFASLSFDACIWEVVMALCSGARLCLAQREDLTPGELLLQVLHEQEITHATLPSAAVSHLPSSDGLKLECLIVAGESCPPSLPKRWASSTRFFNAYGPTEASVCASMYECEPREYEIVPIGQPISNVQIYILDERGEPLPIGVSGEICIGGVGVARGYLHRPELTAERFIDDRLRADGGRLYKTGDLGRWRADGTIEFIGRNDEQVKIRGYRIELGEVEAQLARHDDVREVVVIAREDIPDDKRLVAYVTTREKSGVGAEDLRVHMRLLLPQYMIPGAIVLMQALPLTPNGKVDRRALPAPELSAYAPREYQAPNGHTESTIASIWQELLRVERVGRNDNFFELGGHSLLVMQAVVRIRSILSVDVPMRLLFESPTLRQLCAEVEELRSTRLLRSIADGGEKIESLLAKVTEMSECQVQELLGKLSQDRRV